jgi:replicative DNA helicase
MNRSAPHNDQVEAHLLGTCLLSREAITATQAIVRPEHFYKPAHALIFQAILDIDARGERADLHIVGEHLKREGLLDNVGGEPALVRIATSVPAISLAGQYAAIVEELATFRAMISAAGEISELGYAQDDIETSIDHAEKLIYDLAERRRRVDSTISLRESLEGTLDRLEMLYERGDSITGLPTGYVDLDQLLGGLQPGALYVVGSRPAMGKTAFGLGIAAHAALEARVPALFFSLEMSHLELSARLLCAEARVDATKIRNGRLTQTDWEKVSRTVTRIADSQITIDDNPSTTVADIRSKARRVKAQHGLGLIVVDYVQLMTGSGKAENRQVEVAAISRSLKTTARELDVPVVALAQLNRGLEQRADKRPLLSDLRESGALEQDADVVLMLYRDEVYNPQSPDQGLAEVIVAKHRAGPIGAIRLAFLAQHTKFVNVARG